MANTSTIGTLDWIARRLGVPRASLVALAVKKRIPAVRAGGRWLADFVQVEKALQDLATPPKSTDKSEDGGEQ